MADCSNLRQWTEAGNLGLTWLVAMTCVGLFIHVLWKAIYNLYFHPLSKFPGPKAAAATPIPFVIRLFNGRLVNWTSSLHSQYGEIVRILPDELSFVLPEAWQDIFNSRPPLPKPSLGIWRPINDVNSFATTNNADDHNRIRKILNPAFSDRALKAQEYILQDYTDLLITRLREQISSAGGGPITVDVDSWYGFTTFDTVGDLCFGDSFQSLQNSEHHPWVQAIFKGFKFGMLLTAFDHFGARELVRWFLPRSLNAQAKLHAEFTSRKIDQRIQNKSARPDFMSYILNHREKEGMSRDELDSTGVFLVFAGSETSASVSTSTTWFTLKNPLVMRRLQQEVRGNFVSAEDIKLSEMSKLPYLHAVILEAMRLQPVSPVSIPREVDRPGTIVCGHEIPVGTRVGIPQKPAYRLPQNFVDPLSFLPERWLKDADPKFAADRKTMYEPFLVGPRNCMGQNLAWAEMKLILCKMFWNFDLALAENNPEDWTEQKVFLTYERIPLNVKISLQV